MSKEIWEPYSKDCMRFNDNQASSTANFLWSEITEKKSDIGESQYFEIYSEQ